MPVFKTIQPAARLALVYLAFSVLWILLSDDLAAQIAHHDIAVIHQLQTAKGIVFVLSSGLLLFFTARNIYRNLEDTLFKKEELLKKLYALNEASGEGIVDFDVETDTAQINEEMKRWLGLSAHKVHRYSSIHNLHTHPDDRSRVAEYFTRFLEGNSRVWQWEYRYLFADGNYRDIISRGYVIRDQKTNKPLSVIYTLQDVTELRHANAKYYEQQLLFRQSLSRKMIDAQEQERNRWAQELHDNVCQVLTVAKLYSEQAVLENGDGPFLQKSRSMVEKAINDIRNISSNLKPPEFDVTTLYEAICGLIENIKRFVVFDFSIEYDPQADQTLSSEQKLMVYRVIQEQLNNVMKYSGATRVIISVSILNGEATVKISDNGKGFDPSNIKTGIGLKNIKSRLHVFSGNLAVESSPGNGCHLTAHFSIL